MCKIAILENCTLFGSGIIRVLNDIEECEVVIEARKVDDFLLQIKNDKPDIIVFDIVNCVDEGIKQLKKIKRNNAKIPILLIVSENYANWLEEYIALGVKGFVFDDSSSTEFINAIRMLKSGEDYFGEKVWMLLKKYIRSRKLHKNATEQKSELTKREVSVMKLLCKGLTYREIGSELSISPRTVETHKRNISSKLDVKTTPEMVTYALHNKFLNYG